MSGQYISAHNIDWCLEHIWVGGRILLKCILNMVRECGLDYLVQNRKNCWAVWWKQWWNL